MVSQLVKLVEKDFIIQKKSLRLYLLIGAALIAYFSLMNLSQEIFIVSFVAFTIIFNFISKALYEDEKNNTLRFLVSMPMEKEVIVYARYISVALMSILITSVLLVLDSILVKAGVWKSTTDVDGAAITGIMGVYFILMSIYLPLAFKLGYIKAAGINRFIFIGLFLFFGILGAAAGSLFKGKPPEFISRLEAFLSSMDAGVLVVIFVAVILLVYMISMNISVKVFKKRDLFK